ncbi:MAG: sarcosine oxidase subunit alpha family protein [Alphaproteobacteria bacterium]|nr:sarcosine oxidase subunit alpha family protein [Alphaproteobacteria bacterium]
MSAEAMRLSQGGVIDRSRPLRFRFNGAELSGFAGDTLASALLANDVHLVGRSFKYHRPRGILGAGYEDTGALVQLVGTEDAPNRLATRLPLREGLAAKSVNCWPGPRFDLGAAAQLVARLLPAGFYYKTFMWPHWHAFEPFIRRAAGLGTAPRRAPVDLHYENRNHHCDVLVAGAGPAGLMAALTAARAGARVLLVDDGLAPGGRLLAECTMLDDRPALEWVARTVAELDAMPGVVRLQDASVWAYHEHNFLNVVERSPRQKWIAQRNWKIRAGQVVLATGALERPLVFPNNDRPGVMLASAAQCFVNAYAVRPGRRAVLFTNNDSAYAAVLDLADAGVEIMALVDARTDPPAELVARLGGRGIEALAGHAVVDVGGAPRVHDVDVAPLADLSARRRIPCDLVCLSGGWNPTVHLLSQSGGRPRWAESLQTFVPDAMPQRTHLAGAVTGAFDLASCLRQGAAAGATAALAAGFAATPLACPAQAPAEPYRITPLWFVAPPGRRTKAFVDLQSDVTLDDLRLAIREGFSAIEHVKRFTTAGMGVDQGKTGNVNVIGAVADVLGRRPGDIGTTTFRPPYVPVEFGAIAAKRPGPLVFLYRRTPMTKWHEKAGAVMYEAGARWRRPGYYPRSGETMQQAIDRECCAVRKAVGIYDGSPLGKFEIAGPDAVRFLDLMYTNAWGDLAVGHGRYGMMLSDDGLVLDDGVSFRTGEDRWLMMSSTGGADAVYQRLEQYTQLEWPELRVVVTPVTTQWANATVCGPLAREVLRKAGTDVDLDPRAFPFMTFREGKVAGLPTRIYRVTYTGELSFEVNVAGRHGLALWQALMDAGREFGIEPVGSEANHVLRVEKGFLSLGHEVDGTTDPYDLGMGWIVGKSKSDFIGKRALQIRRGQGTARRELVGFQFDDGTTLVPEGSPITPGGAQGDSEGYVSACVWSEALGRTAALGLLLDGRRRFGERIWIRPPGRVVAATVVKPAFYDLGGQRMRG